jgi:hypothetical protein
MTLARALMRRTEKGKHYGIVTAKFVDVLRGVLWGVHNAASGRCFPSYEAIAEAAACSRTTAAPSGCSSSFLTWVNRIKRVREWVPGLFGKVSAWRWRVIRTSNATPSPTRRLLSSIFRLEPLLKQQARENLQATCHAQRLSLRPWSFGTG